MAQEFLRPGVFVQEVPSQNFPIQGIGTSTAALIGIAQKGALNVAKLITSFSDFERNFGSYISESFLAHAVQGFFLNGGTRCYVAGVKGAAAAIAEVTLQDRVGSPVDTLLVQALNEGTWGNDLTVSIEDGTLNPSTEIKIIIKENAVQVETWDNVSMDDTADNFVETVINGNSFYIQVTDLDSASGSPNDRPAVQADTAFAGGLDDFAGVTDASYIGSESAHTGIHAFDEVDEVAVLVIPGITSVAVVTAGINYAEDRKDLIYIVDSPQSSTPTSVKTFRQNFDTSYAALYYPWGTITDPITSALLDVPPSGHVAGVYARVDRDRGVHKAPANETVRGFISLEKHTGIVGVTPGEQEILNPIGVNAITFTPFRGIRIMGARTMSSTTPELRYIHKRRFLLFVEESIEEGTGFAVFEPNNQELWFKLRRSVSSFLRRQFLEGALFGESEEEAFFVKVDDENNPVDVRRAGQVIIDVGVNIVDTAEFVIFRIGQFDGGASITELVT